jgi:hypothetical protein
MRINFAAGSSSRVLHDALSQGDKDAIVQALKQEKQRDATVFILDTGWPDETQYNTSLTELRRLIDFENKWYGLDPVTWERPRKFTDLSSDNPPKHCVEIMQALQEFTDLDREVASQKHRDPKVKVVYVPLSRKQKSDQILMELLKLSWVRQEAINDHPLTGDRLRKLSDGATAYANVVLKNLDPNGIDEPDFPKSEKEKDSYQQTWKTDSAIVTAVWYLADWASYTNSERPVYFLNESWTVLPDTIHLLSPAKSYGIVVAAVGEDYGVQINDGKNDKEFARLAAPANNVLAALDAKQTSDESDCDSNSVVEDKLSNTMAASFDGSVIEGKIVDGGVCGTSFSAPRIAWILALSEAIRANEKLKEDWADSIQQKLLRARRQDATHQWQKLYLHPGSILP